MKAEELDLGIWVYETKATPPMRWRVEEVSRPTATPPMSGCRTNPVGITETDYKLWTFTLYSYGKERVVDGDEFLREWELWERVKV